jgi:hypothetical protein
MYPSVFVQLITVEPFIKFLSDLATTPYDFKLYTATIFNFPQSM